MIYVGIDISPRTSMAALLFPQVEKFRRMYSPTHIVDLETGHILWFQEGKKKAVVDDFNDQVSLEWIKLN